MSVLNRRGFLTTALAGVFGAMAPKAIDLGRTDPININELALNLQTYLADKHPEIEPDIIRSIAADYAEVNADVPRALLGGVAVGATYGIVRAMSDKGGDKKSDKSDFSTFGWAIGISSGLDLAAQTAFSEAPNSNDLLQSLSARYKKLTVEQIEGLAQSLNGYFDAEISSPVKFPSMATAFLVRPIEDRLDKVDVNIPKID